MPCDHLSEFLNLLADRGDLARISVPVDPAQELAAITQEVVSGGGPALLFDNVLGFQFPVVSNLLGTEQRLCWALGVESFEDVAERIRAVVQPSLPQGWLEALQLVPRFVETAHWPPQSVDIAVAQQVTKMGRDVNLGELPILRSWPLETHPVLQSGQVIAEFPTSETSPASVPLSVEDLATQSPSPHALRRRLVSRVPVQVRDAASCFLHWSPQSPEWQLLKEYQRRNSQMPVAVAIGGDPTILFAVDSPVPAHVDPFVFAGFLRRQPVTLTRGRSINLHVPANAELILEGTIDPARELEVAPPIGQETGYYSTPCRLPVMHVTAITHRSNPILPMVVATTPPCELDTFARASETIFRPLIQLAIPELVSVHRPASGAYRHIVFASIRKTYPQQARKVMNALWGLDQLATSKLLVIVDDDVDVANDDSVWFAVASHAHPGRDTLFSDGPADMLDHASPIRGIGSRMGIDATRKLPDEGHPREWPESLSFDADVLHKVNARRPSLPFGKKDR